jgi:hypothetical protein
VSPRTQKEQLFPSASFAGAGGSPGLDVLRDDFDRGMPQEEDEPEGEASESANDADGTDTSSGVLTGSSRSMSHSQVDSFTNPKIAHVQRSEREADGAGGSPGLDVLRDDFDRGMPQEEDEPEGTSSGVLTGSSRSMSHSQVDSFTNPKIAHVQRSSLSVPESRKGKQTAPEARRGLMYYEMTLTGVCLRKLRSAHRLLSLHVALSSGLLHKPQNCTRAALFSAQMPESRKGKQTAPEARRGLMYYEMTLTGVCLRKKIS